MGDLGFSTGCLYHTTLGLTEIVGFYEQFKTTAIELSFGYPSQLQSLSLVGTLPSRVAKYSTATVHAPWLNVVYKNDLATQRILDKLQEINDVLQPAGFVLHPDTIEDFAVLERSGLPFLLENLESRKSTGRMPEDFRRYASDYGFGFVFDIQHAYTNDQTMVQARELLEVMGGRLHHAHVSGYQRNGTRTLLHHADNKDEITSVLALRKDVPWILEGAVMQDARTELPDELAFVRRYN